MLQAHHPLLTAVINQDPREELLQFLLSPLSTGVIFWGGWEWGIEGSPSLLKLQGIGENRLEYSINPYS